MTSALQVLIVGGTHGNEFSGIQLLQRWQQQPLRFDNLMVQTLFANPKANQANRRFLDDDLNREFTPERLCDFNLVNYEALRAKSINQQFGPKGASQTDLVIDLHNTTANMGPTLILLQDCPWERQLAAYVKAQMPEAVILMELEKSYQQWGYLCTIGKRGVMVEVGPQPQSVLRHDILDQMDQMTQLILEFASLHCRQELPQLSHEVEVFTSVENITLPLNDEGKPLAMVHRRVEGSDFTELAPGEPIFQYFDGSVGYFEGERTLYPTFVNEAAYYNTFAAFSLADKLKLEVPAV
ncbi:aspartoacylase [Ferrimonas lipolytica]|uniref:Aspartoacylase n=1 Tax=Ferrimonas lipolytica TaxID=2724191 RepID=A0A6H1UCS5_9GAMM|nr:aspartoacylase [Ferrimonas lipolytica]QIZ76885.1 aspartoacylase [Ferrimonas lipolytica]